MSHYFDRQLAPDFVLRTVPLLWEGRVLDWAVGPGVFCGDGLDAGTALLLSTMSVAPGERLLDIGCGSGPLGLLPHLSQPSLFSVLTDVSAAALVAARENVRRLGLTTAHVVTDSAAASIRPASFDVAVTNPPIRAGNQVVEEILMGAVAALRPGGRFGMVVRVRQGGHTLARRLAQRIGVPVTLVARKKGFLVFWSTRPAGQAGPPPH